MNTIALELPDVVEAEEGFDEPFLYDTERLHAIASDSIIERGLSYFKEDWVTDLHWDRPRLISRPDKKISSRLFHH